MISFVTVILTLKNINFETICYEISKKNFFQSDQRDGIFFVVLLKTQTLQILFYINNFQ